MGECAYSSTITDLGIRWRWVVSSMPQSPYPQGKGPRYPLDRRVGHRASLDAVEKKVSYPFRESKPGHPVRISSLYRLSYPGSLLASRTERNNLKLSRRLYAMKFSGTTNRVYGVGIRRFGDCFRFDRLGLMGRVSKPARCICVLRVCSRGTE
jgi:hypothetical protein